MPTPVPDLIREEAQKQGVPPELALAVAEQESSFNPGALGKALPSGERAVGTFQILPSTAKDTLGIDPTDPRQNIQGGVKYLRQLMDMHKGDLNQVLRAYGGVRNDTSYVPGVMARISKFKQAPATDTGVGTPPPSKESIWNQSERLTLGGPPPDSSAKMIGGMAGSLVLGAATEGLGLIPEAAAGAGPLIRMAYGTARALPSIFGAGAGGATAATVTGHPDDAGHAFKEQAGLEAGGQAISWPLKSLFKRGLAKPVMKYASDALDTKLTQAQAAWESVFGKVPPSAQEAGRAVEDVAQGTGPARRSLNAIGKEVETSAASGPPVKTAPILEKLKQVVQPLAAHEAPATRIIKEGIHAGKPQADVALTPGHPLPKLLADIQTELRQSPEIPFARAHEIKTEINNAVNWDRPAKSTAEQFSKGVSSTLRETMRGHAPYDTATEAYDQTLSLFERKSSVRNLHKVAENDPEALVRNLNAKNPTRAQQLQEVLLHHAEQGGDPIAGQSAWNAVRSAWTYKKLIQPGMEAMDKTLQTADPEFLKTMFGDQEGQAVLGRLKAIKAAKDVAESQVGVLADSTLAKKQSVGQVVGAAVHVGISPHSPWAWRHANQVLAGPQANELVQWAAYSPQGFRMLVKALTGPAPGMAVADLMRYRKISQAMPSHEVGSPPPGDETAADQPEAGPPSR